LDTVATASGEIRTREHRVPTKQIPVVQKQTPQLAPTLAVEAKQPKAAVAEEVYREPSKSRSKILIPVLLALVLISAIGYALTRRGGGDKSAGAAAEQGKSGLASNTAGPVAPPVMTAADSLAIAEAVRKQLAAASAAAAAAAKTKPGQPVVAMNTDSLRKALQQKVTDSVTRVMAAEAHAAAVAAAPVAAPAPAPAPAPTPAPAGKSRLSIATPATNDQASVNTYSKAFNDALRAALGDKEALSLTDGGESDLVVTPTYVGSGDTVTLNISVRDLRKNTAGIRVLHAKVMPAYPQYYVDAVVKAVVKMIDEMAH
ncbi:MAG TPA: hypothetical protein VNC11_02930, partial [Gemmatimonadaceae bacterium]|nr:hypothetical protein [Gemmatimonadaceae bacterium]